MPEFTAHPSVKVEEVHIWAKPEPIKWTWRRPFTRGKKALTLDQLEVRLKELDYQVLERDEVGNKILVHHFVPPTEEE